MYQAIYYDFKEQQYYLRDDKEKDWLIFKHQPTFYERIYEYKEGALSVLTGGWALPTKKYNKDNPNLLEKDINKELLILRDLYYKQDEIIPSWHNYVYLDIETEIGGALTMEYIKQAPMPITSIAIIDKTTKTKICFIVDSKSEIQDINENGKIIISCKDEKDLVLKFLDKWEEIDPTVCVTWNGDFFDIPYLYFRLCNVVGKIEATRLSPIKKISVQDWNPKVLSVRIGGINHLDYMLLHKKYITKQEPSYKLGNIGEKYVNLGKIEYEGNLNQLFKKDKQTFIDYNLRDVEILEALEEKLKFIELTILISHICNTPYEQIHYNTVLGEGAILKYLKKQNIVSPNKPTTHNPNRKGREEIYAGGYLLEPTPGLYFDCIDLDYTSLYPSIIKSLNIGVETLVGRIYTPSNYEQNFSLEKLKLKDPNEELMIQKLDKINYNLKSSKIKLGELIKIIEENKYAISASGAMFRTDEQSVTAKILEGWFEKREYYRNLKKKAGNSKDWDNFNLYDLFQHAFKILQNAMYGTFAKNIWRYTDGYMICSCAITNTGQRLDQESINFVNNKLNKEYNTNENYIKLADTDSMYIELKNILDKKYGKDLIGNERNIKILEIANEIQNAANLNLNDLCIKLFNLPKNKYFQLKQEVIASSILATGKRRYGMFVTNKEGVPIPPDHKDALDLKGLEIMKSNMNPLFKSFGEKLIKNILFGKSKNELDQDIINFYREIKQTDPKKLGKPTGVKIIKAYTKRQASEGEIFSETEKGAPFNTKAAIRYNDILRWKGLDSKYESIIEGDKIFVINLKHNMYNIDTIGLPNSKVPEEIEKFVKEYIDVDEIFDSLILNKLKELFKDLKWSFPPLNHNVGKFFSWN